MDVNKFTSQASQKISDKNKRKEFERELRCHIEDLTEHFEDMGYPKEEATQKALETMGNSEKVGEEMGKVHNKGLLIAFDVLVIILMILPSYLFFYIFLFFNIGSSDEIHTDNGMPIWIEIILLFIIPALMLLASRKGRHKPIMYALSAWSGLYILFRLFSRTFYSDIILAIRLIITGKLESYPLLLSTWLKYENTAIAIGTIIMFALFMATEILIILNTKKLSSHPTNKAKKFRSVLCVCVTVLTLFFVSVSLFSEGYTSKTNKGDATKYGIAFVESDEIIDFENVNIKKGSILAFDYDLFQMDIYVGWKKNIIDANADIDFKFIQTEIPGISYGRETIEVEYKPTKRYMVIIPLNFAQGDEEYTASYEFAKWLDTKERNSFYGVLDNFKYCEKDYKIKVK